MKDKNISWTNAFQIVHNPYALALPTVQWYSTGFITLKNDTDNCVNLVNILSSVKVPLQFDWFQILLRRALDALSIPVKLTTVAVREQRGRKF
jgi:hypothetical protein